MEKSIVREITAANYYLECEKSAAAVGALVTVPIVSKERPRNKKVEEGTGNDGRSLVLMKSTGRFLMCGLVDGRVEKT